MRLMADGNPVHQRWFKAARQYLSNPNVQWLGYDKSMKRMFREILESDSSVTKSVVAADVAIAVALSLVLAWIFAFRRRRQQRIKQEQQQQQPLSHPLLVVDHGTRRQRRLSTRTTSIGDLQAYLLRQQRSMTTTANNATTTWIANAFADGGCMATSRRPLASSRELLLTAAPGDSFGYYCPKYYFNDVQDDAQEMAHVSQELLYHIAEYEDDRQQYQQQQQNQQALFVSPRFRARTRSFPKVHHNHGSTSSSHSSFLQILGPAIDRISYKTMVPPPTWTEASRNLMLSADDLILSRTVTLHIPGIHLQIHRNNNNQNKYCTAVLCITKKSTTASANANATFDRTTTTTFSRYVEDCRIHIRRPAEGGVMDIYEQRDAPSDRSHWMEHAFASAAQAAQFQLDLLSLQIAGNSISNMYQAFAMLHQGSMAYIGEEPVVHYDPYAGAGTSTTTTASAMGTETQNDSQPVSTGATTTSTTTATVNPQNDTNQNRDDVVSDPRPVIAHDSGIAWDDVMRCLGTSYPSIRLRLEAMWWLQVYRATVPPSTAVGGKRTKKGKVARNESNLQNNNTLRKHHDPYTFLTDEYSSQNRRLLLGPVDFFRLFVPVLPETAVPEGDSSRLRVEKLLRWRKRIASAVVMVQAYVQAKIVTDRGWKLGPNIVLPDNYLKRRLAFDDDVDNRRHDAVAKNEYYEATVSRDIIFRVRCPLNTFQESTKHRKKHIGRNEIPHTESPYQGYSLVGIHAFHCEQTSPGGSGVLHYMRDPVQTIPSLGALIESHPEVDFFVNAICAEAQNAVIVQLYVRSLPKGLDSSFDMSVHRFIQGDANVRNRKLHVILQLGNDRDILSWFGRFLLWWFSFLLRLTFRRHIHVAQPALNMENRTFIPAINLSELGDTCHFGGSLQTDPDLPSNYVASTLLMSSKRNNRFVTRMLLSYIEFGGLARNVCDFTYFLMGDSDDELPERALCTFRAVHVTLNSLQMSSFATENRFSPHASVVRAIAPPRRSQKGISSLYFKIFVTDPSIAVISSLIRSFTGLRRVAQNISLVPPLQTLQPQSSENLARLAAIDPAAIDPIERAVNDLVEILENVRSPVRRVHACVPTDVPTSSSQTFWISAGGHDLGPVQEEFEFRSILHTVSREDMKRYFIASDCSLRTAAVRLIESSVWRGITFPIDIRTCRVELQNGQFFQQGKDKNNNPVFYFRNTCLGPWRKDEKAVISAVLHRLEGYLNRFAKEDPSVQCTLIVVMGKPYKKKKYKTKEKVNDGSRTGKPKRASDDTSTRVEQSTIASAAVTTLTGTQGDLESVEEDDVSATEEDVEDSNEMYTLANQNNPRVYRDEQWHSHTNRNVVDQLLGLVMKHYPERLSKALIVLGHGNKQYVRSAVGGVLALPGLIPASRTREKILFLTRYRDLQKYIDSSQLLTSVGGTMLEDVKNYEYK